jgi:hypothetical protein
MLRASALKLPLQQCNRQQGSVAFVHVIDLRPVLERFEDAGASEAQHCLLCQPIVSVPAIEMVGKSPVPGIILFEIGVEQVDWNCVTGHTFHVVTPRPNRNRATLDEHRHDRLFRRQIAL